MDSLDEGQPDGSVLVFLDESYDPFVAAAAVVVESDDMRRIDEGLAATYNRVKSWYRLDGMPNFEEFRQRGFHATNDPFEVRAAFVAFLAEALNFKSIVVFSDRSVRRDISDKQRLIIIIDQLIRDTLGAYRSRPKITFCFESAQGVDKYLERVVMRAVRSFGGRMPDVEILFGTKRDPHLLAVPDYVLHIFNQWLETQGDEDFHLQPSAHQSRSFKAILGSISAARSLDDNRVVRRTM